MSDFDPFLENWSRSGRGSPNHFLMPCSVERNSTKLEDNQGKMVFRFTSEHEIIIIICLLRG